MDFREQINEDIAYYQDAHPHVANIEKPEWAFNYWVLDKLFCEDEDEIENKIIDYSDHGIDCFIWHEESKDLYLIQNKYYSDSSALSKSYFTSAVEDGYGQLVAGTYTRSAELQSIFNANRIDPDFYVYHYFYVTNDVHSSELDNAVQYFNTSNESKNRSAQIFYLSDIQEAYYGEPIRQEKHIEIVLETPNKGTRLNINNKDYGLGMEIDAKYIMLPVVTLYKALREAEEKQYPIFDANIREYLGAGKSVNKRIIETLKSEDKKRFFFYNNGITIICSEASEKTVSSKLRVSLTDPQIVNGCQTVSSIKHVLENVPSSMLDKEYEDVYVMAKILEIPNAENEADAMRLEQLRKNIVRFNNSQNSINEKTFEANNELFFRVQLEFEKYGFLLCLKQSDKHKFSEQYKSPTVLKEKAHKKLQQFGLEGKLIKTQDFTIDLEKFLQVCLAYFGDAQQAFQKKGNLLKKESRQYDIVTEALRKPEFTTQRMLDLYLFYLRAEKEKAANKEDGKIPITWYMIESFAAFECGGRNLAKFDQALSTKKEVDSLIRLYATSTKLYLEDYVNSHQGEGYNSMIKESLDLEKMRSFHSAATLALQFAW